MTAIDASLLKFHISLNASDLGRSVAFYRVLLGVEPAKVREDYAKFELAEPPLVLSLIPGGGGGNVNHAGLRVRTADELVDIQRRLEAAGIATQREEGVECCYARQTKFWVADPDQMLWEVYLFHEDIDERGDATVPIAAPAPVVLISKPLKNWMHRLGGALPDRIPHDANSLLEVTLEGSFNAGPDAVDLDRLLTESLRVLRPGAAIRLHGLTGDSPGNYGKLSLPGPAAAVEYAPTPSELTAALTRAGFRDVQIVLLSQKPYFVVEGVGMRECRIQARKPGHRTQQKTHHAVYRGPLAEVTDDCGNVFRRGEFTPLNMHDWQMLSKGDAASSFILLSPVERIEAACDNTAPPAPAPSVMTSSGPTPSGKDL
jgi:catechol 2,3-dioxygenase-like lactoylglutathione lyase family enzyme